MKQCQTCKNVDCKTSTLALGAVMGAGPASDIVALLLVFVLDPLVMGEATANISVIEVVFFVHVTCCREVSGNVRHVYSLVLSASPVGIGGCILLLIPRSWHSVILRVR